MANPTRNQSPPKATSRKKLMWWGGGAFLLFLVIAVFYPQQGSVQYGICKVFVELNEPYPKNIKPLSVDDFIPLGGPVKITYKRIDPFGVDAVNTVECFFKKDAAGNATTEISKVDINGKTRIYNAENPDYIAHFNVGIPAILENLPSLDLPSFSLDNLSEYKDSE